MKGRRPLWAGALLALGVLTLGFRLRAAVLRRDALLRWEADLGAMADAAKRAVGSWIEERLADGRVAAAYAAATPAIFERGSGSSGSPKEAIRRLAEHLALLHNLIGYVGAWVVDRAGRPVAGLAGGPRLTPAEVDLAVATAQAGRERFAAPALQPDSSVAVTLAVPIRPGPAGALGSVVLRVDPAHSLFPLLQSGHRLGSTADLRIVVHSGDQLVLFTPMSNPPTPALSLRTPWAQVSDASRLAIGGTETFGTFVNTTGTPIVAVTRHIAETGWGLISRVEEGEALAASWDRLRTEMVLAVAVLGVLGLGFLATARTARLARWKHRIESAAALEASEKRYRQLFESSLGLICTHDLNGILLSMNPAGARALGLTGPADATDRSLYEFLVPAVRPAFAAYLGRIHALGTDTGFMRVLTASGEERIWEYHNTLVQEPGRDPYVLAHAHDITQRQRVEEALRYSESSYRSLVQRATYGIYRSTPDGRFLAVNPALVRMLGYESEPELLALNLRRLYADPDERDRLIRRYSDVKRVEGLEVEWKRKDGGLITVRLSGSPARNARGELEAFDMIVEDVTERRTLEAQLRQAQKMEAVGQLTGGIAHDFNNLLTVVLANADLVAKSLPPDASDLRADVEDLRGAARRGATMVKKLLAFSRREDLKLRPVELPKLLTELSVMLRPLMPEHITLETGLMDGLPPARAYAGAVEQILLNLVTNARDAMPAGGILTVTVAPATIDEAFAAARGWGTPGSYLRLSVSDTGTGMDRATLARMFEPFFTTKPPGIGTGLGLAMVYGLVKQQNGFIDVDTRVGHGTRVDVYLPQAPAADDAATEGRSADMPGGTETILLVEDEEGIRRSASRILSKFGYQVLLAADGQEALELFHRHRADIDLVVSDVVMPRLGGRQLYEELQREEVPPKFLYTTGYAARDVDDRRALDPAVPLMQKPWTVSDLLRHVRQTLDGA
jgi:PAS domain S-box-containing protein